MLPDDPDGYLVQNDINGLTWVSRKYGAFPVRYGANGYIEEDPTVDTTSQYLNLASGGRTLNPFYKPPPPSDVPNAKWIPEQYNAGMSTTGTWIVGDPTRLSNNQSVAETQSYLEGLGKTADKYEVHREGSDNGGYYVDKTVYSQNPDGTWSEQTRREYPYNTGGSSGLSGLVGNIQSAFNAVSPVGPNVLGSPTGSQIAEAVGSTLPVVVPAGLAMMTGGALAPVIGTVGAGAAAGAVGSLPSSLQQQSLIPMAVGAGLGALGGGMMSNAGAEAGKAATAGITGGTDAANAAQYFSPGALEASLQQAATTMPTQDYGLTGLLGSAIPSEIPTSIPTVPTWEVPQVLPPVLEETPLSIPNLGSGTPYEVVGSGGDVSGLMGKVEGYLGTIPQQDVGNLAANGMNPSALTYGSDAMTQHGIELGLTPAQTSSLADTSLGGTSALFEAPKQPLIYGSQEMIDSGQALGLTPEQTLSLTDKSLGGVSANELSGVNETSGLGKNLLKNLLAPKTTKLSIPNIGVQGIQYTGNQNIFPNTWKDQATQLAQQGIGSTDAYNTGSGNYLPYATNEKKNKLLDNFLSKSGHLTLGWRDYA